MKGKELAQIRHYLGKTQNQLARLLCVSPKAIESFEQGWRPVPVYAERYILFLLSIKKSLDKNARPCWQIRNCSLEMRENCPAWEFKAGNFCWFINGTFCQGEVQEGWEKKIKLCQQCKVFRSIIPLEVSEEKDK